jgi:hypothetical protein
MHAKHMQHTSKLHLQALFMSSNHPVASIVEKNVFIGDISPYLDTDWHYLPKT